MPNFKNTTELFKHVQNIIDKALNDKVSEEVKQVEADTIKEHVYSVYDEPQVYKRRKNKDGLSDKDNMISELIDVGTLEVRNETMAYPDITIGENPAKSINENEYLTPIIVNGGPYDFPDYTLAYNKPRDFIKATKDNLETNKQHIDVLIKELKKNGIKLK